MINNLEDKSRADLIEIINIQIKADQKREKRITELEEEKRRLIIARNEKGERIAELKLELGVKRAQIDRLMLEYCPDEMTGEQLKEWESRQVKAQVKL